jgi:predicted anti-sigma-YlaC factor YlaD
MVYDVSEEELEAYLAEVAQAGEMKAREKAERQRQKEVERCEQQRARAERKKALKKERIGAAAVIVRQCGVKSVKQLAQELGISTQRVREIYEAEGCL